MTKQVNISKSDYARALTLAERFNINAGARPNRKVKAVLSQAAEFLQGVSGEVAKGNTIETGSAWHGPDEFLTRDIGRDWAIRRERTDYLTGDVSVTAAQKDAQALSQIRRDFGLSSDKQAARLAIRVFEKIADGLWRGNGFSYANERNNPQAPALDTRKVRNRLFPQMP